MHLLFVFLPLFNVVAQLDTVVLLKDRCNAVESFVPEIDIHEFLQ
jgi:hypothetical protein